MIVQLVQYLAWPVVAVWISLLYRKDLAAFLSRVRTAKLPGGIEVQVQAAEVLSEAARLSAALPKTTGTQKADSAFRELEFPVRHLSLEPMSYTSTEPTIERLAGIRADLVAVLRTLAVRTDAVSMSEAGAADLSWLAKRIREARPELVREMDIIGQLILTADRLAHDPSTAQSIVNGMAAGSAALANRVLEGTGHAMKGQT